MRANHQNQNIRRIVMIGVFTAIAYVAMLLIHIKVGFLTMDVKDAMITICGLFFGPVAALLVGIIVPLLELFTVSTTGVYGLIMNILSSVTFSVAVSLFYKWKKTLWGAVLGLASGVLLMTAVMMLANLFITPYYMGATMAAVRALIPTLLLPFNLLKGLINAGAVLLLYKPLSTALRKARLIPCSEVKNGENSPRYATKSSKTVSIYVTLVAILLIAASIALILTVMGGTFTFGV